MTYFFMWRSPVSRVIPLFQNWILLHMIPMIRRCTWHFFVRRGQGVSELCPFFKIPKYPYWVSLCLKLLPQFSSHLTKTCCTLFLWYVDVNDIFLWRAGSRVAEICPFFKFLSNPYWDSLCLKLLPQFSSHLLKLAAHCVYESCEISATI